MNSELMRNMGHSFLSLGEKLISLGHGMVRQAEAMDDFAEPVVEEKGNESEHYQG